MPIDIDALTEAELVELNHRVVARLRALRDMRAHVGMLEFGIGDHVTFEPRGRPPLTGMVTHYNRKTVTVITAAAGQWNVAPNLLRKAGAAASPASARANVVVMPKR